MSAFRMVVGMDLARRAPHKAVLMAAEGPERGVAHRAWSVTHDVAGLEGLCTRIRPETGQPSLEGVLVNSRPSVK